MKKIKILLLLFVLILLSGCSGTYNLKIKDNFSVEENLNIKIDNRDDETVEKTKEIFESNYISKDKYKISVTDNNITIDYKESYKSIEDYILNSKLYTQLFDSIEHKYSDGILSLNTSSKMLLRDNGSSSLYNNYDISLLQVNIESPFNAKKTNADIENEDILSWSLNKDTKSKQIMVDYDVTGSRSKAKDIILISIIAIILIGSITVMIIRFYNARKL